MYRTRYHEMNIHKYTSSDQGMVWKWDHGTSVTRTVSWMLIQYIFQEKKDLNLSTMESETIGS